MESAADSRDADLRLTPIVKARLKALAVVQQREMWEVLADALQVYETRVGTHGRSN